MQAPIFRGKLSKIKLSSCCSVTQMCPTLLDPHGLQHTRLPISWSLLKLMSTESMIRYNYLILYCSILLPSSIFASIRVFSSELALHITWPQYWSFSFSISPPNEYSALTSFRVGWFDLSYSTEESMISATVLQFMVTLT